jgi:hypothetical protein
MLQWINTLLDASKKIGRYLNASTTYRAELERVGYTDIVETTRIWPMNRWPKDPKFKELGMSRCYVERAQLIIHGRNVDM